MRWDHKEKRISQAKHYQEGKEKRATPAGLPGIRDEFNPPKKHEATILRRIEIAYCSKDCLRDGGSPHLSYTPLLVVMEPDGLNSLNDPADHRTPLF